MEYSFVLRCESVTSMVVVVIDNKICTCFLCSSHYNYNALCGGLREISSMAYSFVLRCESVTSMVVVVIDNKICTCFLCS